MGTPAQNSANQANAQLSTGPRTDEGKAISSQNALRSGFNSQTVILAGEDPAEYDQLLAGLRIGFPSGGVLALDRAVREMANAEWRLRRARLHQELIVNDKIAELALADPKATPLRLQLRALEDLAENSKTFKLLLRYETKFERQFDRAQRDWYKYRKTFEIAATPAGRLDLNPQNRVRSAKPVAHASPGTQTPRNAPCPCGSGEKYKRCCGKNALPVLFPAA